MTTLPSEPYPGLRPFLAHEAPLLMGRAHQVREIITCMTAKTWKQDNGYQDAIKSGLKVAKKQAAPDFIRLPVHAPKQVTR